MSKPLLCRIGFHKWKDVMAKYPMTKEEQEWASVIGLPLEYVDHHVCTKCGAASEPDYFHCEGD